MLAVLIDGLAYGLLLFVLASGFAMTLRLMNFMNLAHGAFAMAGGYVTVLLMARLELPFVATLPAAFAVSALLGLGLEALLYRRLVDREPWEQVLFSLGLVYVTVAAAEALAGPEARTARLPAELSGEFDLVGLGVGRYPLFVIAVSGIVLLGLQPILSGTRLGARIRALLDEPRTARGLGLDVTSIHAVAFAFASGLAGLAGALATPLLGLKPDFPVTVMITVLMVAAVGGASSPLGPFIAALMLGFADVAVRSALPALAPYTIYALMLALLLVRPAGLLPRPR